MVKIIIHGCSGHMGKVVAELAAMDDTISVAAGVDVADVPGAEFPVFRSVADCDVAADVVVDFSVAAATDRLLDDCVARKLPLVLCTTGLSEEQTAHMNEAARIIPILKSANMSLGINTMMKLIRDAARVLAPAGFDIEIVERHHNRKLDAPSGTALALADSINEAMAGAYSYVYDRSQTRARRSTDEIGISAVRGGTIVGDHDVIFAGTDEVIEIRHSAYSRSIFAKGALEAARYLVGRPAGKYDMSDVISGS